MTERQGKTISFVKRVMPDIQIRFQFLAVLFRLLPLEVADPCDNVGTKRTSLNHFKRPLRHVIGKVGSAGESCAIDGFFRVAIPG